MFFLLLCLSLSPHSSIWFWQKCHLQMSFWRILSQFSSNIRVYWWWYLRENDTTWGNGVRTKGEALALIILLLSNRQKKPLCSHSEILKDENMVGKSQHSPEERKWWPSTVHGSRQRLCLQIMCSVLSTLFHECVGWQTLDDSAIAKPSSGFLSASRLHWLCDFFLKPPSTCLQLSNHWLASQSS